MSPCTLPYDLLNRCDLYAVCWLFLFPFCLEDCRILGVSLPNRILPESLKLLCCTSENATWVLEVREAARILRDRVLEVIIPKRTLPEFSNKWYHQEKFRTFEVLFVSSNNAHWIPEFRILFLLDGSRTVLRDLSLLICTRLYNYYSSFLSWNFNTSAH